MNKQMAFYDGFEAKEKSTFTPTFDGQVKNGKTFKTSISAYNHETGEVIFEKLENKVIISGSSTVARALFDVNEEEVIPSYNDVLDIPTPAGTETSTIETRTTATEEHPKTLLFCVGTDGCGSLGSQIYPVDYKHWIAPEDLIPLRYQLNGYDINDDLRESYFGRSEVNGGEFIAYYFKRFTTDPVFIQRYVDGTPIDSNIWNSSKTDSAESFIELKLTITKEDIRDYFLNTVGIDEARINSIQLCTAWPKEIDGYLYFQDIRPLTKLHFSNEYLIDVTKGIDIIYHIYT